MLLSVVLSAVLQPRVAQAEPAPSPAPETTSASPTPTSSPPTSSATPSDTATPAGSATSTAAAPGPTSSSATSTSPTPTTPKPTTPTPTTPKPTTTPTLSLAAPSSVSAVASFTVSGKLSPARSGVAVAVVVDGKVRTTVKTSATGEYKATLTDAKGLVRTLKVQARTSAPATASPSRSVKRVARFDFTTRAAKSADVRYTLHAGCPVGRSKLTVVEMNFYGLDKKYHRGQLVVRSTYVTKTRKTFQAAFDKKFPIRQMRNPNGWKGKDVPMMEADNSSAFNCRKVVGNPYRRSPHSYGYAIDINPRENPYRADRWYPTSGLSYRNRSKKRPGMHFTSSVFPVNFRKHGGHWGGSYADYHHFEFVRR